MKFCKDCANFQRMDYNDDDGNCYAREHGVNLVTGKPNIKVCSAQRDVDSDICPQYCGKQAQFFKEIK